MTLSYISNRWISFSFDTLYARRKGSYGAATEDYLKDGQTPISNFVLAGDSVFPGIGVPTVAISGTSAANGLVSPFEHWKCLDKLEKKG